MPKEIPPQINELIESKDFSDQIVALGESLGLNIDQIGELCAAVNSVLLGLIPSRTFTKTVKNKLEINDELTERVINELNIKVFSKLKTEMRAIFADNSTQIEATVDQKKNIDKENILNGIENPTSSTTANPPINLLFEEYPLVIPGQKSESSKPTIPVTSAAITSTKPIPSLNLMDRMMSSPVSTKTETVEKKIDEAQKAQPMPSKPKTPAGPDPYREPLE
jgi:hypothetical protein